MKPETFYNLLAEQNLLLSDQQKKQFERYFEINFILVRNGC